MSLVAPGQRLVIDLCGPFPSSQGFRYIFTAVEAYTRFVIAVPIRNKGCSDCQSAHETRVPHLGDAL